MTSDYAVSAELVEVFVRYAQGAGAQVAVVAGPEVAAHIAALREGDLKCTAAVRESYPALYQALAASAGLVVVEDVAAQTPDRSALGAALAGGTSVLLAAAGVAETGSLLLADQALAPRLAGMLVDVCVALLPAAAIVPSLDVAGGLLAALEGQGCRYLSLVTGPSRSGDIEMALTIGVHGPKTLHIIILQETTS
jgi:L-lactate dehydrogenase complex protein LldG